MKINLEDFTERFQRITSKAKERMEKGYQKYGPDMTTIPMMSWSKRQQIL